MTSASTAICAVKQRPPISSGTMTAAIRTSISSRRRQKKRDSAKKPWKAVRSKRSATTGTARNPVAAVCNAESHGQATQSALTRLRKASAWQAERRYNSCRTKHRRLGQQRRRGHSGRPENVFRSRYLWIDRRDVHRRGSSGQKLERKFGTAILVKGGHLEGDAALDLLFIGGKVVEFSAPKAFGVATHGTGCTYSAAISAGLASGLALEVAIRRAKKFVAEAIAQHFRWTSPSGKKLDALRHLL